MLIENESAHREVKEWFYNQPKGTEVLYFDNSIWNSTSAPCWDVDIDYIINDEYVKARKAFVEGMVVLYQTESCLEFLYSPEDFKLCKPEDIIVFNRFKLNDWVVSACSNEPYRLNTLKELYANVRDLQFCDVKLWKPEEGEFVWFWGKVQNVTRPLLGKYSSSVSCGHIEPFIGNLPSFYTDK